MFPSYCVGTNGKNVQQYKQLLMQYNGKVLPKRHPTTMIVERVGSRIFKAACDFAKENKLDSFDTTNVTFTVVDSDQANAFVLPGNHVFGEWYHCVGHQIAKLVMMTPSLVGQIEVCFPYSLTLANLTGTYNECDSMKS